MASESMQVDEKDFKFLLKRTGFLLLGALVTAIGTVWVPFFEGMEVYWAPIIAMALTGLAEAINRFIQDYKNNPPEDVVVVYRDKQPPTHTGNHYGNPPIQDHY